MNRALESYSDIIAHALQECVDPTVIENFRTFLHRMGDQEWLIVSDYHIERNNETYENDVLVFTVLPAAKHYLDREQANEGLPRKLSSTKGLTDSSIKFLKELNHFTFIFVSDKKFRPTVKNAEDAIQSIDVTIQRMLRWRNADECSDVVNEFRNLRKNAHAKGFNLKLLNQATLAACFASSIGLLIVQTLEIEVLQWLSDRDPMIDNLNGIVYTMFHLNMVALHQQYRLRDFTLAWFGENAKKAPSGKMKPLALAPFIRIPDYFAAPIAASKLSESGRFTQIPNVKYHRMLTEVIADNPNVAMLRFQKEPGWGFSRIIVTRSNPNQPETTRTS